MPWSMVSDGKSEEAAAGIRSWHRTWQWGATSAGKNFPRVTVILQLTADVMTYGARAMDSPMTGIAIQVRGCEHAGEASEPCALPGELLAEVLEMLEELPWESNDGKPSPASEAAPV